MKTLWEKWSKEDLKKVNTFCEDYRQFLSVSKTEREFTENSRVLCEKHGFKNIGRVHAAAQCAAEPDALFAGFGEQRSTAGEQPAAQGEQTVAHRAAGRDRADGQSGETTRRKRRAGKERASQHDDDPPI